MKSKFWVGLGVSASLGAVFFALGASGVAASPNSQKIKIHCTSTSYNVAYPQLSGLALGVLHCPKPFGDGVQKAKDTTSITGTTVNVTGSFTNYFNSGTNRGTIKLSGTISNSAITASGPVTITGGTGAYKHMRATGNVTCTTTDAGKTFNCTVTGRASL